MRPAYSVIIFTAASGAGYGLLVWLALTALFHGPAANRWFAASGMLLALALVTAGLVSSTFHLGRPERAWLAFSQWRSSWLSREGVFSIAAYPAIILFGALWLQLMPWTAILFPAAILTIVLCTVTVYCTAKIYSSLPTIPQWRDPFVDIGYLVLSLATGAALLAFLTAVFGFNAPVIGRLAAASLIAAAICKLVYWRRIDAAPPRYTMGQATGLGSLGSVRQWEPPHTGENFVMREMGYSIGPETFNKAAQPCSCRLPDGGGDHSLCKPCNRHPCHCLRHCRGHLCRPGRSDRALALLRRSPSPVHALLWRAGRLTDALHIKISLCDYRPTDGVPMSRTAFLPLLEFPCLAPGRWRHRDQLFSNGLDLGRCA